MNGFHKTALNWRPVSRMSSLWKERKQTRLYFAKSWNLFLHRINSGISLNVIAQHILLKSLQQIYCMKIHFSLKRTWWNRIEVGFVFHHIAAVSLFPFIYVSSGATVVCLVSCFWGHTGWADSSAEHSRASDRWCDQVTGLKEVLVGTVVPGEVREQGSEVTQVRSCWVSDGASFILVRLTIEKKQEKHEHLGFLFVCLFCFVFSFKSC